MRDLLPEELIQELRDRYLAGVADAEALFHSSSADEDSLTGALGHSIASRRPYTFSTSEGVFSVEISYTKLRGRGLNAPERLYGSDGIFQIEVRNQYGDSVRKKGLPFQAKTNWRNLNSKVASQAADMRASTGEGIVIDYSSHGYQACPTGIAINANGDSRVIESNHDFMPLGQVLANEFLDCRIGRVGLFFNTLEERYYEDETIIEPSHAITTRVTRHDV